MRGSAIALRIAQKKVKELEERLKAMQEWLSPETMTEMEKHGWVFE
jgi:hypothetical protein